MLELTERKMLPYSRTIANQFQDWKGKHPEYASWKEYRIIYVRSLLETYEKLGFVPIGLAKHVKIPHAKVKWAERSESNPLTWENAYAILSEGQNIAINLKASGLIVIDHDTKIFRELPEILKPYLNRTMSAITPHDGHHILFRFDKSESLPRRFPSFILAQDLKTKKNMLRGGPNGSEYIAVAPSHILDEKVCNDPLYYEWLDGELPIPDHLMNFSEFVEEISE